MYEKEEENSPASQSYPTADTPLLITCRSQWWLWSVMGAMRPRDPGSPESCPDNHLPSLSNAENVKARKRKIPVLFAEISPLDGKLWIKLGQNMWVMSSSLTLDPEWIYFIFWGESDMTEVNQRRRAEKSKMDDPPRRSTVLQAWRVRSKNTWDYRWHLDANTVLTHLWRGMGRPSRRGSMV